MIFLLILLLGDQPPQSSVDEYVALLIKSQPNAIDQLRSQISDIQRSMSNFAPSERKARFDLIKELNGLISDSTKGIKPIFAGAGYHPKKDQITSFGRERLTVRSVTDGKASFALTEPGVTMSIPGLGSRSPSRDWPFVISGPVVTRDFVAGADVELPGLFIVKEIHNDVPQLEPIDEKPIIEAWKAARKKRK